VTVAFVTYERFPDLTDDDRPLLDALATLGVTGRAVRWDTYADWAAFDAVVIRSCWDYFARPGDFIHWLEHLERVGAVVWNPVSVLRWNMHKGYLRDLERAGIAIPRTVWLERGESRTLADVMREAQWRECVVKPAVSGAATHTWRVTADDVNAVPFAELLGRSDVLVQELIHEVAVDGEWSVMMIDGNVSHAAIKRPKAGDFRVQTEHGGSAEPAPLSAVVRRAAADVVRLIPGPWLYARVDGVVTSRGFLLMELECIEPHLFFGLHPESRMRFCRALLRRSA
jgi:glutathione synthase/RimK-type ligase-like ATP-grasp enzyme